MQALSFSLTSKTSEPVNKSRKMLVLRTSNRTKYRSPFNCVLPVGVLDTLENNS
jgi:hypothetical protein